MQAKSGFKAQGIAGGKADPLDALISEKFLHQFARFIGRQANFKTVFAGIA
ncbi:hypothetical protein D3C81_2320180 [compost metagenome]